MWAVAGVLLGIVLLASLLGFHIGPHAHATSAIVGVIAAAWLLAMAFDGRSAPMLWTLFGADLALSGGVGVLAWKGLQALHNPPAALPTRLEGEFGVAVGALEPDGLVRVRGESWSATSLNGNFPAGTRVQVIGAKGVRLEVWGEGAGVTDGNSLGGLFELEADKRPAGAGHGDQKAGSQ